MLTTATASALLTNIVLSCSQSKHNQSKELELSESKFRSIFENIAIGMGIASLDGTWLTVNNGLCNMLGYSESELLSTNFQSLTHPDDLNLSLSNIEKSLKGEIDFYHIEKRYIHKSGDIVWIESNSSVIRDSNNNPLYFVTVIENITEMKKAEAALKEAEMKFRNLVEESPVGVYILQDHKLVYVNPRMSISTGFSEFELIHANFDLIIAEEDRKQVWENIESKLKGINNESRLEIRIKTKHNKNTWVELFGTSTVYKEKPAIIGTMIDVSEKKEMIKDLLQRNNDLEQFSFIVSHNLRGPLSTILGMTVLLNDKEFEENKQTIIQGIIKNAAKIDDVVKDLNSILTIKSGSSALQEHIELSQLIHDIKYELENDIQTYQVQINASFDKAPSFTGIKAYAHSILLNLISNSIKYKNPELTPKINISSEIQFNKMLIKYSDNGQGIDLKKYGEKLFGMYKKFNFEKEGKGLGLFMVKNQVVAMGGKIEVSSTPGKGTQFLISIPLN